MALSQRYWIAGYGDVQAVIWDSHLAKYVGNGKGSFLVLDTWKEAEDVVAIMAQRVGA